MVDYTVFYKRRYRPEDDWHSHLEWDLLISAFNSSERVKKVFSDAGASEKHWLILPEYNYSREEYPLTGKVFAPKGINEADLIQEYFAQSDIDIASAKLCIDITGFMRPHLMFLIKYLMVCGAKRFDALYSDPGQYVKKEETKFSDEIVLEVRQVSGFEGNHIQDTSNDVLIIGSGYDHQLIAHVAENKAKTRKLQLLGFPSLQADMYQENVLRASLAQEAVGGSAGDELSSFFAPASDPFVTASVLRRIVEEAAHKRPITNLYLSPLSTKPQVLGFILYYLTEWQDKAASIIFPFCAKYTRETAKGISKIWRYTVELPQPSPEAAAS